MPKINVITIISYLPQLIAIVERLRGRGNGADKKKGVLSLVRSLFAIVDGLDVLDPATEKYVSGMIDLTVEWMNARGEMPDTPSVEKVPVI